MVTKMPETPKPAAREAADVGFSPEAGGGVGDGLDDCVVGVEGVVVLEETTLMSTF